MAKILAIPPKVDLSSSTEREKAPEAPHKTPHSHQEGPLMGHAHAGALPRWVVGQRADGSPFWAGRQHLLFLQSLGNLLAKKLIKAEATNGLKGGGGGVLGLSNVTPFYIF